MLVFENNNASYFGGRQSVREYIIREKVDATKEAEEQLNLLVDPIPMSEDGPIVKTQFTTNQKFCDGPLTRLFGDTFSDFAGVILEKKNVGNVVVPVVTLYFRENNAVEDPNKVKAITRIGKETSKGTNLVTVHNQKYANKQFELTTEAREILAPFVMKQYCKNAEYDKETGICYLEPKWNDISCEVNDGVNVIGSVYQNPFVNTIMYKVSFLDVNAVLSKLYGKYDLSDVDEKDMKVLEGLGVDLSKGELGIDTKDIKVRSALQDYMTNYCIQFNAPLPYKYGNVPDCFITIKQIRNKDMREVIENCGAPAYVGSIIPRYGRR